MAGSNLGDIINSPSLPEGAAHSVRLCKLTQQQPVVPADVNMWSRAMPVRHGQSKTSERSNDLQYQHHPFCFTCNSDHRHWALFTQLPQHVNAAVRCAANQNPPGLHKRGLRRVTLLVPIGCAQSLVHLARELRTRQKAGMPTAAPGWRRLSECRVSSSIPRAVHAA
jgi:hypothetical protein